jgi:ribosomal protein L40E
LATLEYTDAPSAETTSAETTQCPLCGTTLPKDAEQCTKCDWVQQGKGETAEGKASDAVAVLLSVVPGLGHVYKGHTLVGLMLIFAGTPMAVGLALLIATGTAGFGVLVLPVYWVGVMFHVYGIQDRVLPGTQDDGEEY